jgi:hypothetical protein
VCCSPKSLKEGEEPTVVNMLDDETGEPLMQVGVPTVSASPQSPAWQCRYMHLGAARLRILAPLSVLVGSRFVHSKPSEHEDDARIVAL